MGRFSGVTGLAGKKHPRLQLRPASQADNSSMRNRRRSAWLAAVTGTRKDGAGLVLERKILETSASVISISTFINCFLSENKLANALLNGIQSKESMLPFCYRLVLL